MPTSRALLACALLLAACDRPRPERLAGRDEGLRRPYGLAQDAARLYWTDRGVEGDPASGAIRSVAKQGGPVATLTTGVSPWAYFCCVAAGRVYWTEYDTGRVRRVAAGGGPAETWEQGLESPGQIAARDGVVYWVEYGGNAVRSRATGARAAGLVARAEGPQAVAVDDEAVYWTETGDPPVLRRRALTGGAVTTLAQVKPECWLVPAGNELVWTETRGPIRACPRRGGPVRVLGGIAHSGGYAAATGGFLFWSEEADGVLRRVPLAGGRAETLWERLPHPCVMVADRAAVYWADASAAAIYRFAPDGPPPQGPNARESRKP
jgi:hypothetical protein